MTHLTHSLDAFIRKMQMSSTQVFAFVEGQKNDAYFYGELCQKAFDGHSISYDIRIARELSNNTGGKPILLNFFRYLRRKSLLLGSFKGKQTAILFFLDKDIDEITREIIISSHIIYTKYYDIEGHIFNHGIISRGGAATASIEHRRVAARIGDESNWRRTVAEKWRDWIKLCIFTKKYGVRYEANYGAPSSKINVPPYGSVDSRVHNTFVGNIKIRSGKSNRGFLTTFNRISIMVDELYRQGRQDEVFKGKWYAFFLEEELKIAADGNPVNLQAMSLRLSASIATTLDFSEPWTDHFIEPIKNLIAQI